jgi:hypothetical protein
MDGAGAIRPFSFAPKGEVDFCCAILLAGVKLKYGGEPGKRGGKMSLRKRLVDRPFPARNDTGEAVMFSRPELWAYPSTNGETAFLWDGRFRYWANSDVLDQSTHPAS